MVGGGGGIAATLQKLLPATGYMFCPLFQVFVSALQTRAGVVRSLSGSSHSGMHPYLHTTDVETLSHRSSSFHFYEFLPEPTLPRDDEKTSLTLRPV